MTVRHTGTPTKREVPGRRLHVACSSVLNFITASEMFIKKHATCVWGHLVQQLHHAFSLLGSPHLDGGSTANPAVLLLDFGGSTFGDDWCQPTKSFNMKASEF